MRIIKEDGDIGVYDPNKKPHTMEEQKLAEELFNLIEDLIVDDTIDEQFTSDKNLLTHFKQHCIAGDLSKKSTRTNIYYDFNNKDKFRLYSDRVLKKVLNTKHEIVSISKVDVLTKELENLFKGNYEILFYRSCGFYNTHGIVRIGLHSFSSNVTTNYIGNNTIDLLVMDSDNDIITIYPIDAHYFETKFNSILRNHSKSNMQVKINR